MRVKPCSERLLLTKFLRYIVVISLALVSIWVEQSYSFQNFFNVPNSFITAPKRFYFQQQISSTTTFFEADSDLVYGLGNQWEMGVAVNDVKVTWDQSTDLTPFGSHHAPTSAAVIGVQKKFILSQNFSFAIGTKNGVALNNTRKGQWASRGHLHFVVDLPHLRNLHVALGPYYFNSVFIDQDEAYFGLQGGIELPIFPEKIHFVADFMSGTHVQGSMVFGGSYWFSPTSNLSLGAQLPWPKSLNSHALVLELTFL